MPSTQTFVPVLPLEDDDDDELVDPPLLLVEPLLLLLLLEEAVSSPQNAFRDRPHATSELPHTPSTHAAARYELPLEQLQHDGLQSAKVEQLAPILPVPRSFSGFDGHEPFCCSALDEMLLDDEPLEEELLVLEPLGSLGFVPDVGTESVPPLHAMRKAPAPPTTAATKKRSP